jgi:putative sterol carrier protein
MAKFGTIEVYEEMARLLNEDPEWADKGKAITYTMIYAYGPPADKTFFVRFEQGRVTDVKEIDSPDAEPADFVLTGPSDVWRGIFDKTLNPTAALTRGQLKVKGKMTTLLKHMSAFSYVIDAMTKIELT